MLKARRGGVLLRGPATAAAAIATRSTRWRLLRRGEQRAHEILLLDEARGADAARRELRLELPNT
jgi:hypothetical protein